LHHGQHKEGHDQHKEGHDQQEEEEQKHSSSSSSKEPMKKKPRLEKKEEEEEEEDGDHCEFPITDKETCPKWRKGRMINGKRFCAEHSAMMLKKQDASTFKEILNPSTEKKDEEEAEDGSDSSLSLLADSAERSPRLGIALAQQQNGHLDQLLSNFEGGGKEEKMDTSPDSSSSSSKKKTEKEEKGEEKKEEEEEAHEAGGGCLCCHISKEEAKRRQKTAQLALERLKQKQEEMNQAANDVVVYVASSGMSHLLPRPSEKEVEQWNSFVQSFKDGPPMIPGFVDFATQQEYSLMREKLQRMFQTVRL
jgi:hypothetical protein